MQYRPNHTKPLLIILISLVLLILAGYVLIPRMLDLDTYRAEILTELQKSLKRPVTYSTGKFKWHFGPAFDFSKVEIREPDGSEVFVTIERLTCDVALLPLFEKKVIINGLQAVKPVVRLVRTNDGRFNISDLMEKREPSAEQPSINHLRISKGIINFIDYAADTSAVTTRLVDTDLYISSLKRGGKSDLKLSGSFEGGATGRFALNGKAKITKKDLPFLDSVLDVKISAKQLDVGHFWPYYSGYVPFKKIFGLVDADTTFKGRLREFSSNGKITFKGLRFDYRPIFKVPLTPTSLSFKYNMELTPADVLVKAIELSLDGVDVKGSCAIRGINSSDPRITAQAVTSDFDFDKYKQYVPYGIIVDHVAKWIEEHIKGGIFRLDNGRLDGRVSQIAHMEKGENYKVLYIKGRVEKGLVTYGSSVPTFNNIKGMLEMKEKDFNLRQMSGRFGTAPLTMEGQITDYPLDRPSAYPFRMTMSPGQDEIVWLMGKSKGSKLFYNGKSSLRLTGDGFTSGYNLAGEWNLTPAVYTYSNIINKQAGVNSSISFKGSINPREAVISSLRYSLGRMSLNLNARYPYATGNRLDLAIATNQFDAGEIAAMLPVLSKYKPSGRLQLAVTGESPDWDNFRWKGSASLANASFAPSEAMKPVTAITGSMVFNDASMESSQLTARIGNTVLTGSGAITSFNPIAFTTSFTTPRLDLTDFGFAQNAAMPQITRLRADISLKDNNLQIRSAIGQINSSALSVRGVLTDLDNPSADLTVASSYLNITDLMLLGDVSRKGNPRGGTGAPLALKATVKADTGQFRDIPFEKLNSTIQISNRIIYLQPLEALTLGGKLTAKGRIDTLSSPTRYQTEFKLVNASAGQILQQAKVDKRELTGTMSLDGEFTARGETPEELKRSALGSLKINAHNGSLRQFPILSKVFSILNVSQLFKLHLPDMVSEGMPYNEIKASMAIKDGSVSTNDLFIASNAMNISMIGKYDFIRDNMDLTLGIQPLQTVDKVVSRIPIVGWILTGKDKSLITTYFEVKGKSSTPQVSAIPVKYLGRGVLDIFKRVFQLPAKLVTDTGEVVLGN